MTNTNTASVAAERFTKKPVTITASQWFKNGDHPEDYSKDHDGFEGGELRAFTAAERKANDWEGDVVRYYRHPDVPGDKACEQCGKPHHVHGWIDTIEQGHRVCPGDWIITGVAGEMYPCKPDIFAATYSRAALASAAAPVRDYPQLPDFDTVEQHIYSTCRRYITQDMLHPIHNLIRDAIDADRAAVTAKKRGAT